MTNDGVTQQKIDIFTGVVLRVAAVVLLLWLLYTIRDVVWLFLMAIVIAAALNPLIRWVRRYAHFSPTLIVGSVYAIFFSLVGLLLWAIVPVLSEQFAGLMRQLPVLLTAIVPLAGSDATVAADVSNKILALVGNPFSTTMDVLGGVISLIAVLSMAFYMSLQEDGITKALMTITPTCYQNYVSDLSGRIQENFGRWMAGQLMTMFFVGVLYYIALTALGVPYALVLALIGGLLEIVPYFGPIFSAIPAVILGFSVSPLIGVLAALAYWAVNLIENYFLVPKIMNRAVGLHPVFVILALLIGMQIAGVIGVLLAVPIAGALGVFLRDVIEKRMP